MVKDLVDDVREKYSQLLPDLVKDLSSKQLQSLAATKVMETLVTEQSKAGVMQLYYFEVLLYTFFVGFFTRITYVMKFTSISGVTSNSSHMTWAVFALIFAAAFIVREISQLISMKNIGVAYSFSTDFWNWIDLFCPTGAIITISYFFKYGQGVVFDHLASVAAMLMWMKYIGIVKALDQQVATFVLMLSNILFDVRAFMFVMALVMIMFAHGLFLVLGVENSGSNVETGQTIYEWERENDITVLEGALGGDWETKFDTIGSTGVALYSMMLGDYDPDQFESKYAYFLSAAFMFIVVVVMLNVLIAIVSDSYDNAMVRSNELFWSARLSLVAEVSTTFKATLENNILVRFDAWAQRRANDNRKATGDRSFSFKLFLFLIQKNEEGGKAWAIRILFCPITIVYFPLFLFYIYAITEPLKAFSSRLKAAATADIVLKLSSNGNDEDGDWSGRVLDIVKRVNTHSSAQSAKFNSEMKIMNEKQAEMKRDNAEMKEMNAKQAECLDAIMRKLNIMPVSSVGEQIGFGEDTEIDNNRDVVI